MKLTIKENSKNYTCTVVEIKEVHPIEGADKIQRTIVFSNNVIISKDVKIGDKMLYFVSGTKLNPDFCKYNNLLTDEELNKDKKVGYISHRQFRVKALKLKGVISDGILLPIQSLECFEEFDYNKLNIGDEFTDINDISICEKYFVPVRNSNPGGKQPKSVKINRLVDNQFYLHNDTDNLRRNIHKILPNSKIGIHYKKHGTSVVIGNVLVKKSLKWYERLAKKVGFNVVDTEYDIIYSSRKVIKNAYLNTVGNSFYKTDVWGDVKEEIKDKIPKNYTLYGEILGFEKSGSPIQGKYDYGCNIGEHKFYVYRITVVNPDGQLIELTDKQIEEFCEKHGLLFKDTFIFYGKAVDLMNKLNQKHKLWLNPDIKNDRDWQENFLKLLELEYNEKNCYMSNNVVPEEGIVLRVEKTFEYEAYKLKSKRFVLWENDQMEKGVEDIESQEDINIC